MRPVVEKVVSGGQTGVDRAGLDAAIELGIETGGWVPKGRKAEDGRIPARYDSLRETVTANYADRTEMNVRDSDGTLIVSRGKLSGGSLLTLKLAQRVGRPVLHIDLSEIPLEMAGKILREWLVRHECRTLNVAGPRASSDPQIYAMVRILLAGALQEKR